MNLIDTINERIDLCKTRIANADDSKNEEAIINSYYHIGEVASLHWILGQLEKDETRNNSDASGSQVKDINAMD